MCSHWDIVEGALEFQRPDGLDDPSWAAIEAHRQRLQRAERDHDLALIVGTAKELVEAVAKVTLDVRGETVGSSADFSEVINRAHAALDRQPGHGLASDAPTRDVAQAGKTMALKLGELRNQLGTGHGRVLPPETLDEHAFVCAAAARLWCGWALRRLDHLIAGVPAILARDLTGGKIFRSGNLETRLLQANLPSLDEPDQRMLGKAVAHRAMQDTFIVRKEGVEACAASADMQTWPEAYRAGVIEGLFIDRQGYLDASPNLIPLAARILNTIPRAGSVLGALVHQLAEAELVYYLRFDPERLALVLDAIESAGSSLSAPLSEAWLRLASAFAPDHTEAG